LLAALKNDTILRELVFQEENQSYKCKGFALEDHPVVGELAKFER
jgi:GTP-binding protein HflX